MQKSKLILPLFVGFCCISYSSYAQVITQEEFLNQLKQSHPVFEKEKLTSQVAREQQNSFVGAQDWNIFSSVNLTRETPTIALAGPERTDALTLRGGVERLFWHTGGRLTASFSTSRTTINIDPVFGLPDAFFQNELAVTYTHPLMRNKQGFLDQFQYELQQYDIDFSEIQAIENQEDFLASSAGRFLDWAFLTEQSKIVFERLKLSEEELARTQRKREANLVDKVDVIRAADAVRITKQNQVLVESQWKAIRAELAVLTQNRLLNNLTPEFDLYSIVSLVPLEEATAQIKKNSRLIKVINVRIEQIRYNKSGFVETLKPNLSFVAQVNLKRLNSALFNSFVLDKPDLVVGLQFSVPLENSTAKAQVSKTDLQIKQIQKQLEEISLDLESAVTNIHIQIQELEKVLTLNQEQIESAKEKTEEEIKLYNQGRGELTFVIQSQDSEQNAKLTYAQNALNYHKLLIRYSELMDQLYE